MLHSHIHVHAEIYIYILDTYRRNNKDAGRTSLYKYYLSLYLWGFEKSYLRFACERELKTEHNWNILTPKLWPSALCLSRSSDAQPEPWGPFCWLLAFFIASYQHLLWTPIHQGLKPLRPGVAFLTISLSIDLVSYPARAEGLVNSTISPSNWLQLNWLVELNWII